MKKNIDRILVLMSCLFLCCSCAGHLGGSAMGGWEDLFPDDKEDSGDTSGDKDDDGSTWFRTRGLVCGWSDVCSPDVLDYVEIARESGINAFSIYGADRGSTAYKEFARRCVDAGIDLEFEEHMMSFLIPRSLFSTHPEYFRMNEMGVRVEDANGCPSSEGALAEVRKNAKRLARQYEPTNDRYYFWLDDGGGVCHCEKCRGLNDADQALIFENAIMDALKEVNEDAMLAHLCYANTVDPPKSVKPHKDIFLEFAPFYRDWSHPLSEEWVQGKNGMTHAKYLKSLRDHLKVFPAETAQVLEYWMDDSLFSGWNPDDLKPVPWNMSVFMDDLDTYASFGIRNIMCYCAYVGPDYVRKFGFPDFLAEYGKALRDYEK
ncbi:MAG: DUF4838 domain-containing protein [Bacteroides sp.]|nr:DUF4838 domain-containing protein [Bacteroides sp.]